MPGGGAPFLKFILFAILEYYDETVGWRNKLLFGLVLAVTNLRVWVGEVTTKHLYFKMELGWGSL